MPSKILSRPSARRAVTHEMDQGCHITDDDAPHGAQAIVRAISLLQQFSLERPTLTTADLALASGLTVPTAHRILRALERVGMLTRDRRARAYSLGPAILSLARIVTEKQGDIMAAGGALVRIRNATQETAGLHARLGIDRICLMEKVPPAAGAVHSGVGQTYPLTLGAASKAILSLLPDAEVTRIFDLHPAHEFDRAVLLEEISATRTSGYAVSVEENIPGALSLAVPIVRDDPLAPGALSVTGPTHRLSARIELCVELLQSEAAQLPHP